MHCLYCKKCEHLNLTEEQQTDNTKDHVCKKYNKRVMHGNHHPEILRCTECLKGDK